MSVVQVQHMEQGEAARLVAVLIAPGIIWQSHTALSPFWMMPLLRARPPLHACQSCTKQKHDANELRCCSKECAVTWEDVLADEVALPAVLLIALVRLRNHLRYTCVHSKQTHEVKILLGLTFFILNAHQVTRTRSDA